jgi:hypothetical protein
MKIEIEWEGDEVIRDDKNELINFESTMLEN